MFQISRDSIYILLTFLLVSILSLAFCIAAYISNTIMIAMLLVIVGLFLSIFIVRSIGFERYIFMVFVVLTSFNIEFNLYNTNRIGGLPSAIVVNQFYILILVWAFYSFIIKKKFIRIEKSKLLKIFYVHVGIGLLSIIFVDNIIAYSFLMVRYIFTLIFIWLVLSLNLKQIWNTMLLGLSITVIMQVLLGIIQIKKSDAIGLHVLGENQEPFRKGVDLTEQGLSGTLGHPSTFAIFLVLILSMLLVGVLNKKSKFTSRIYYGIVLVVLTAGVLLTNARTSILLFLITLTLFFFYYNNIKNKKGNKIYQRILNLFLICISITVVGIFFFDVLYERFAQSDFVKQYYDRLDLSLFSLQVIFKDFSTPFTGVGLNNYVDTIGKMGTNQFKYIHPVHNYYLLLWAEGGLFYMLSFVVLLIMQLKAMRNVMKKGNEEISLQALAMFISIIVLAIYNFSDWAFLHNQLYYLFILIFVLIIKIYNESKKAIHFD
ncbi:O-antigen ligase family protein [Bacillus wiedmannii]|uniref:O-antigen ligase family protein n=1 Tax=Bacillus wiedmannii TaxID=1890302 RepID=UPI000B445CD6|nr:O-antigen ligase family protein [Bacillus wiedmannii]MCU5114349.1 hypothetical protein [Bacillus wiedmannii]MCU5154158.1 hypothetical protein [Bacillus wiedmannii]MCU5413878.1 hypothetical protein [Bacillus wiedmannii]OUB83067.1 hypothetical protein BK788_18175 [Bacillus thuringiensis serovar sinensis]